jgi:hypothetical protein
MHQRETRMCFKGDDLPQLTWQRIELGPSRLRDEAASRYATNHPTSMLCARVGSLPRLAARVVLTDAHPSTENMLRPK